MKRETERKMSKSMKTKSAAVEKEQLVFPEEKISCFPLYCWRIFGKLLSFFVFGLGSVLISIVAFPVMKLIWRDERSFQNGARRFISFMFRFFIRFMTILSVVKCSVDDENKLKNVKSAIVVANHPSLLDVVMLISRLPQADAIVAGYLSKGNILTTIAKKLYITSDKPNDELMALCRESLKNGNTLIIFPEGTRSKPTGQNPYKKGAARIALASGCPIVPVYIGGNNKIGLRKKDPMFLFNPTKPYLYNLYVKESISPEEYKELPPAIAARRIMHRVKDLIGDENNAEHRC